MLSLILTFLTISTTIIGLLLFFSSADLIAQLPHSSIKDQLTNSADATGTVYTAETSEFLSSKNLSLTPYRITEEHYVEDGFLENVGNVTNNQTFENTYLSDGLTIGKGRGTIENAAGQKINWISTDLGTFIDNQWLFYGVILFNNTYYEPLSLLNNSIGVYKSTPEDPRTIWLWE